MAHWPSCRAESIEHACAMVTDIDPLRVLRVSMAMLNGEQGCGRPVFESPWTTRVTCRSSSLSVPDLSMVATTEYVVVSLGCTTADPRKYSRLSESVFHLVNSGVSGVNRTFLGLRM